MAYGALGTPVIALSAVTGLDLMATVGNDRPATAVLLALVPFWLIWAFAGRKAMIEIWPAILVAGLSFAVTQFLVSNYHGPWLVDVIAAMVSLVSLVLFLKGLEAEADLDLDHAERTRERPRMFPTSPARPVGRSRCRCGDLRQARPARVVRAWIPWVILSVFVFIWGIPDIKTALTASRSSRSPVRGLHNMIENPPVAPTPHKEGGDLQLQLSLRHGQRRSAGHRRRPVHALLDRRFGRPTFRTIWRVRYSLLTIVLMLALGI